VARALAAHAVTLHGWVFDIGTGAISAVDDA
jgi:carbonic anhydrase